MLNPKYKANKKNGGVIPPIRDQRMAYVPIGCQECIECKKQKARGWQIRLQEDIKTHKNGKFVTLTYSTESLKRLATGDPKLKELKGYELDNGIATRSMRLFLERWRKKYKKSVRHWMVTELGTTRTEHLHLHGIIWTNNVEEIENIWQYGHVWTGHRKNGQLQNYVNARTTNYIVKYITKQDEKHPNYKSIVLCSPGIGREYTKTINSQNNKYNEEQTDEAYRTTTGHKIALPTYWRNKIYTEEEREKLWCKKLDKNVRWVCGEKINMENGKDQYYNVLEYHRQRTAKLGYRKPDHIWSKKAYEEQRRALLQKERLK